MTANQLMKLAQQGKCVVWLSGRHMPAAFLISMHFRDVMNSLGAIKPYKRKNK